MNHRRIDALESAFAAKDESSCRCLLLYLPGEPPPLLTGLCTSCGFPRLGANTMVIVEEVVVNNHEAAEPVSADQRPETIDSGRKDQ
jgi:hypothetical protein